jgi:hypothetical protein
MTGAVSPTAQSAFWEWIATYGEPWAEASGYKRRGKKAEFWRRVGRLELVITVVRSMRSTTAAVGAWLEAHVIDVPSDRLRRSLVAREKASGHQLLVLSLAVRDCLPEESWKWRYEISAISPLDARARALPQDLEAYRVELEAMAGLANRQRGVFIRLPMLFAPGEGVTKRRGDQPSWYETTFRDVRTVDGRDTPRAIAVVAADSLAAAAAQAAKTPDEVRALYRQPDPSPPDIGRVYWRHPDDAETPIWHEGNEEVWTPPFVWATT